MEGIGQTHLIKQSLTHTHTHLLIWGISQPFPCTFFMLGLFVRFINNGNPILHYITKHYARSSLQMHKELLLESMEPTQCAVGALTSPLIWSSDWDQKISNLITEMPLPFQVKTVIIYRYRKHNYTVERIMKRQRRGSGKRFCLHTEPQRVITLPSFAINRNGCVYWLRKWLETWGLGTREWFEAWVKKWMGRGEIWAETWRAFSERGSDLWREFNERNNPWRTLMRLSLQDLRLISSSPSSLNSPCSHPKSDTSRENTSTNPVIF